MAQETRAASLLTLPAELLQHILAHLDPVDLAHVAQTSRALLAHSYDDQLWQPLINRHLPHHPVSHPRPLATYRDLFVAHQPRWFLPQHRLWFSNSYPHGKLLLARYDAHTGSIQAHTVSAVRGPTPSASGRRTTKSSSIPSTLASPSTWRSRSSISR
ncbi:F-box domain containing protein [Teratosphaeria destructans]|uniref:F-box domain containing protein n=1 Tax=Teratosphaeria destructans TaxID=418781 RepID=A0A9W7SQR3_9PEZI|nr:F-box domain containing protein [Teratosphaeria destructans]